MPPKLKHHKVINSPNPVPSASKQHKVVNSISSVPSTSTTSYNGTQSSQMDPELEQQFEIELCWCIQQLQTALTSGKLNQKQIQDHTKSLNTLKSAKAPIIKKRQVMRLSFGDYRAKMQAQQTKQKAKALKLTVSPAKPSNKSVYIKKSQLALNSGSNFRFNFPKEELDIVDNVSDLKINETDSATDFHFSPSHNEFRFNFSPHAEDCTS